MVAPRALFLLIAALIAAFAAWTGVHAQGTDGDAPVVVGSLRLDAADLGRTPDAAIELAWLEGEAAARGLRPAARLEDLRGQIADAVVGNDPAPTGRELWAAFGAFHARWRERTRCLPALRDPYADRCGDVPPGQPVAACRWLGDATVCPLRGRRWLVIRGRTRAKVRSRAAALTRARARYVAARARRDRAAAVARRAADAQRRARERAAAAQAKADRRAQVLRERRKRARDPRLAGTLLATARAACQVQVSESEPYLFAFGMQDVVGQVDGLLGARATLAQQLRSAAAGKIERRKLRPLLDALAEGDRVLAGIATAQVARDRAAVAARVARLDQHTESERAASRRLGLGDCLVRPAQ